MEKTVKGVLTLDRDKGFLADADGSRHFRGRLLWDGYRKHWEGEELYGRYLVEKDYINGENIIIMWPADSDTGEGAVELYYNERLVNYPVSRLGHIAINVDGNIFNFSHMINETEIITPEEYFYRPALGEFAPHPETGIYNADDPERPYLDKFGRQFMRTIHVLRIEGLDTKKLMELFKKQLEIIYNTPADPGKPGKYADFNIFRRSCSTIIRDGFNDYGFKGISGIFPGDLFVNTAYYFFKKNRDRGIKTSYHARNQLKVPEAEYSKITPLVNPLNRLRKIFISGYLGK